METFDSDFQTYQKRLKQEDKEYQDWFDDLAAYMNWNQQEYYTWYMSGRLYVWFKAGYKPIQAFKFLQDEDTDNLDLNDMLHNK